MRKREGDEGGTRDVGDWFVRKIDGTSAAAVGVGVVMDPVETERLCVR